MTRTPEQGEKLDEPLEILRAAGVECAEVKALYERGRGYRRDSESWSGFVFELDSGESADFAILALARLVAKWRWVATHEYVGELQTVDDDHLVTRQVVVGRDPQQVRFLNGRYHTPMRRWEEQHP